MRNLEYLKYKAASWQQVARVDNRYVQRQIERGEFESVIRMQKLSAHDSAKARQYLFSIIGNGETE